ncbi:MAG: trypsin-like peptidase domain-containing protein [Nitrospirales bacterium]|nr:trypsin-like peptidase domain-containing protein [Nitrospirales bacterium]
MRLLVIVTVLALFFPVPICSLAQPADPTPQQIYERLAPTVVFVVATPDHGTGMGGTGSIIRPDGLILTNAHVVVDPTDHRPYSQISIFLKPERVTGNPKTDLARRFTARVLVASESLDLALLQVEQAPTLPTITFGDPATVRIGDRVLAIGHPEQGGMWTLTSGLISAQFEDFNDTTGKHVFQTDTGLNRGNSGGPLLDRQGQMIGINTAMARVAKDGTPIMSINFAVESNVAQQWLKQHGVNIAYAHESPISIPAERQSPMASSPQAPAVTPTPAVTPAVAPAPQIKTDPHPYDMDQVLQNTRQKQMKEMEDLLSEGREKMKRYR